MKKFILLGVVLLLAAGSFLTACGTLSTPSSNAQNIATITVISSITDDSTMNGKIEAVETAHVVSKMTGKVARVNVDLGSEVEKGQILVSLEAADLQAGVEASQAALDNAQINLDLAKQNLERAKTLMTSGAISQSDFQNNYETPYLKAEASRRAAESSLKKAQIAYEDSYIRAPFEGIITARNLNAGELASIQTPVVSMVNLDQVVIRGTLNEKQINNLKPGQEVQVFVSAAMNSPLTGSICNISPAAESSTKAYPIKVKVENPEHLLKPGMFAEVRLPGNNIELLTIPQEAVLKDGESTFVYLVQDGLAVKRCILTGQEKNGQIHVISGLSEGETVVTRGAQLLRDGQKI